MRKIIKTLLAALVFGAMLSMPAWAESAVVTGNDVNMREGPGTAFRIVDCLPQGERVTVTDRSNPSWYGIEHDGKLGFMSAAFLSVEEEAAAEPAEGNVPEQTADGQPGYVDAMYVRFRSAPGSEFSVLGEYNRGKALTVTGYLGNWTACVIDGRSGYVYSDYIALGNFGGWEEAAEDPFVEETQQPEQEETETQDGAVDLELAQTPAPQYEEQWAEETEAAEPDWEDEEPAAETAVPEPAEEEPAEPEIPVQQVAAPEVEQLEGYINANYVRFRTGPSTSYQIIDSYDAGKAVGVTGSFGEWTACIIDNVFGYVYSDYITVTGSPEAAQPETPEESEQVPEEQEAPEIPALPEQTPVTYVDAADGYVAGNNVRMRGAPAMSAPIVAELSYGNALTIIGVSGDWTAVLCNGEYGFIYSQFVKEGSLEIAVQMPEMPQGDDSGSSYEKGQQIAQYALQFVGCRYSWGGTDPATGFDCSGLVYYTYQHFGITLNRVAQDQAKNGVAVSADELQPGDILCFYSGSSYIGHSGIYIGNGMFVHAQNSATGVVVTELAGHYAERGFEARRVV